MYISCCINFVKYTCEIRFLPIMKYLNEYKIHLFVCTCSYVISEIDLVTYTNCICLSHDSLHFFKDIANVILVGLV